MNNWAGILFNVPAIAGGIFGLLGGYLTDLFGRWIAARYSIDAFESVLTAAAILLAVLFARMFALTVQDRVIRLEERLRYERVLPEELRWRADELTRNQFVSLRFAGDDELPALMKKVLDGKVIERKAIKQLVKNWRPDLLRA